MNPERLYHGSMYEQDELMPGFKRSGKLVKWDLIESNLFLYTSTSKEEATSLGFGSALEKAFNTERYATLEDTVYIYFKDDVKSLEELFNLEIYVYTIRFDEADGWRKNNNPVNGIDTEWCTKQTIKRNILSRERVDIQQWLKGKRLVLTNEPSRIAPQNLGKSWTRDHQLHQL